MRRAVERKQDSALAQRVEQRRQPVMIQLMHQRQQPAEFAVRETLPRKPVKEPLIESTMSRVADQIAMIARSATKVVAWTTMPRSATPRARNLTTTRMGTGISGDLLCCARCEGNRPFIASRALHIIPNNRVRGHVGLNQRFPG